MIRFLNTLRLALATAATSLTSLVGAATLGFDATMHVSPDPNSETIGTIPAGTSITTVLRDELAASGIAEPPPGWIAVRHPVEIEGFVRNKDIGKDFAMKPDSPVFAEAAEGAPVVAMVGPKDPVETGDPVGRFSKATMTKDRIVYVNSVPPSSRSMARSQSTTPPPAAAQTPATAPAAPEAQLGSTTAPAAAPPVASGGSAAVTAAPRTFQGYLMRTRRILGRGPKYDYQIVDENNKRVALLDMSALLVTEPIEFFEGRLVNIYGPGLAAEGVTDPIIRVESLRLAR